MNSILITGDQSVDYNIYLPTTDPNPRPGSPPAIFRRIPGGAGIVYEVLKKVAEADTRNGSPPFGVGLSLCDNADERLSYPIAAVWHPQELGELGGNENSRKAKVWRLTSSISLNLAERLPQADQAVLPSEAQRDVVPDLLVLEDDAMDFRYDRRALPDSAKQASGKDEAPPPPAQPGSKYSSLLKRDDQTPRWIIHKMTGPICHGDLWWHLTRSQKLLDRLILIVSINDLRRESVRISRDISWERTAQDLVCEISHNPELSGLRSAGHLIVTFHGDGALWMERIGQKRPRFHLIFDPQHMEGEWSEIVAREGEAYGFLASFTASIAAHLAKANPAQSTDGIETGIRRGLCAMRLLRGLGHGFVGKGEPGFAFQELAEVILTEDLKKLFEQHEEAARQSREKRPFFDFRKLGRFGRTEVPSEEGACVDNLWRILEDVDATSVRPPEEPLYGVARRVALLGLAALGEIPHACFGRLVTIDRGEIESLRNLKRLIRDYRDDEDQRKPLSLAVFGPPGAGKSFAIKEIASTIIEKKKQEFLEFNLSQFHDPVEITAALHQVRDKVLEGKLPFVFWDEFDSQKYQWLQYLLAPMQDGKFQQGQITHPIGRCVFVFAGATSHDFENFGPREDDQSPDGRAAWEDFKLKKGPDFKSRLHGFLNVLGPNPRQRLDREARQGNPRGNDLHDVCFPVRRALLLRSMLGYVNGRENERMEMDSGLMAALLEVRAYVNGARSLEKIATCLKTNRKQSFCRSNLPSDEILGMNVETVSEFKSIMERAQRFQKYAEPIGFAIHNVFRSQIPPDHRLNVPFSALSDEHKADNYAAAMRIPTLLELVGLYIVPEDSHEPAALSDDVEKLLAKHSPLLAREEHNLWMQFRFDNGWRYGEPRDDSAKVHPCLKPYDALPEQEKEKDRTSVREFPKMVAVAKYKIVARKPGNLC